MERSSQNRPSIGMDLSKRNSLLGPSASAAMDLVKHPGWHSQLAMNHNGAASDTRPGHQSLPQGSRSRSLLPYNSRSSLSVVDHGAGGGKAAVRPLTTGAKSGTDAAGVHGRGPEPRASVKRERNSDVAQDQFHMALRATGGGCGMMYDPDPDELSDSPSPESSDSDSDVILIVSSTREDARVPPEEDSTSSEYRDTVGRGPMAGALPPATAAATTSRNKGRGCFLLPRPRSSSSADSSDSDASSDSTGEILPQSSLLLMSELTAAYSNCAGSPVGISSDEKDDDEDDGDDDDSSDDVVEVPVTNERARATFALEVYNQRLIMQQRQQQLQQQQPRYQPPHGGPRQSPAARTPSRPVPKAKPRPPKPELPPARPATRTLYSRQAKGVSYNMDEDSYDSGDMMNSSEKQSSSDSDSDSDSDAIRRIVKTPKRPTMDVKTPTRPTPVCSSVNSKPVYRPVAPKPTAPAPLTSTPAEASRQTQQQATPPSSSVVRKRMMERETCQTPAPVTPTPAANQTPKNVRAPVSKPPTGGSKPAPARRRRKKAKQEYGPGDLMLSPRELEIQRKYCRPERRENKPDDFCPFVHVRRRVCTVVNCPEDEQRVRGKRRDGHGGPSGAGAASLSGCVPRTSCHQLGRVSSRSEASHGVADAQSRAESSQFCCLCGGLANATGLGDLHGPYYLVDDQNGPRDQGRHWKHDWSLSEPGLHRPSPPVSENGFHGGLTNGYGDGHGIEAGDEEEQRVKDERSIEGELKIKQERRIKEERSIGGEQRIKQESRIKQEVEKDRVPLIERMEEDEVVVISDDEEDSPSPSAKPPWTDGLVDESPGTGQEPPHSPESPPMPSHSPASPTMPPYTPESPIISSHSTGQSPASPCSPGLSDMPDHSRGPSGMPAHDPESSTMPPHSPGYSAIPLHSPRSRTSPPHSSDPPTILPHSPRHSVTLPSSPGPPRMPSHSPQPLDMPFQSLGPSDMPLHSPGPSDMPLHSPEPSDMPLQSPRPSDMPLHSPGPSDMPPQSPGPSDMPLHSSGDMPSQSPGPSNVPPHSPGPSTVPPHNSGSSDMPPQSPGPLNVPPHSPGSSNVPPHNPGPSDVPPHSPGPSHMPAHSPGPSHMPAHSPGPSHMPAHSPGPSHMPAHSPGPPHSPPPLCSSGERWVHEDCGIWSAEVFLVKGRLYGLEEAIWLARETVCTTCNRAGATMGCFMKGCPTKYHYRCAVQSGCALNEENFSMRCPKHKNKSFRGVTRLQDR